MKKDNIMGTSTPSLNEILGNSKIYRVPLYQRDYSWEKENWEDLWDDIVITENSKYPHYMGAIVLQTTDDKEYTVIDGQQRLATLSIIAITCIKTIQSFIDQDIDVDENKERVDLLMRQYIGSKDPASLRYSSKLFLNEHNDPFYQSTLLQFRQPLNYRKLSDSEKLMWDAFTYFEGKIDERFALKKKGEDIADFLSNTIAEKLLFIQIIVDDELNAYTVFETLNSRGIELTSTDLLKNYLFSKVSKSKTDLGQVRTQWKKIIEIIGLNNFPVFLRHYINSNEDLVTKDKLFKRIKSNIKTDRDVFDLLDNLEASAYLYDALDKPGDEFWLDHHEAREAIRELKLFRVTQYKSLAIAAYNHLKPEDFTQLMKFCAVISFRYNIIGRLNANDMERVYNKAATNVAKKKSNSCREVLHDLKPIYVSDEQFGNSFSTKYINTRTSRRLVRYILVKLENQLSGKRIDHETTDATIEHILPENPTAYWDSYFDEDEHMTLVYRLGNYTLLEEKKNRKDAANLSFEEKKKVYHTSEFELSGSINYGEWNPEVLKSRQRKLSDLATAIWRINF